MSLSMFKIAAISGAMLLATVGGAFAATIDYDTAVKDAPHKWADTLQFADAGDYVKVLQCQGNYCYVKISGPDGWVKKSAIDFGGPGPFPAPVPFPGYGCVYGPFGYVCI